MQADSNSEAHVLLSGFHCRCCDAHDNGDDGEPLGEDPSAHEQLGLAGLPLFKGAETVHQCSRGAQAT